MRRNRLSELCDALNLDRQALARAYNRARCSGRRIEHLNAKSPLDWALRVLEQKAIMLGVAHLRNIK